MWITIFFVLPVAGLVYTLWHVWQLLPFASCWRWATIGIGVLMFMSMFLVFSGSIEKMPLYMATVAYETGTSVIFVLLYLVMLFLLLDVGCLVRLVPKAWLCSNGYTASGVLAVMIAIFVYGNVHYNGKVREEIKMKTSKNLTAEKSKLKIVLLSDLHLGYHNRRAEFSRWVDMINAEHPDLILVGGDIIDISVRPLLEENVAEEFHRLQAPVYACFGNHEYYSGEPEAQHFYREAGIHLLCDSVVRFGNLCIIGRDDRTNVRRKPLAHIIGQASINPAKDFTILLDHQPYHLERAERCGVDFQFSGHTHHGQVWPASWVTDALYEDAFGPLQKGNTRYYVSSGMGIWGGKYRIGTRSEYVVLTIEKESNHNAHR